MAGGGTAGHVTPLLAVVKELEKQKKDIEIVFVGSIGGIEEKLVPQTGLKSLSIHSGKFRRYHRNAFLNIIDPQTILKNILDMKNFFLGLSDSFKILKEEDPDIVLLKGGYVSLPLGLACRIKKYPYFIHESDIIPGLANRLLLKKAQKVFVSYPTKNFEDISEDKLVYSGNPVRKGLLTGSREAGYKTFDLDKDLKTILVIGGSQGAHTINMLISDSLSKYLEKYQIIHIAGDYDYDWLEYKSKDVANKGRYKLFNFVSTELKDAYAVSDIVVARAGNNVLTELAALSKPTIIIPIEGSANDHQAANATAFSREGAAYVMMQSHLLPEKLFKQVDALLNDEEELSFLSEKIHKFYKDDASEVIVEELLHYYEKSQKEEEE